MTELERALSLTAEYLRRHVVFAAPEQAVAAALWVGHTWTYDQYDTTAYLAIQSPEKRSGKSRVLECLRLIVRDPVPMAGASIAALFRLIEERHPTLLMDEADAAFGKRGPDTEDLRGLLNNGYRRGVPYWRVVGEGKKMHVQPFDVFCPKAVASIGRLPDTVQDRSIVLTLKRRAPHEAVERFRFRDAERETLALRESWEAIAELEYPDQAAAPVELDDRAADSWEPLLALADAAGGEWPDKARRAALIISGSTEPDDDTLATQLLADVRAIFTERAVDRLPTTVLLDALHGIEESPWSEYRDKGLRSHALSRLLRPYGIRPGPHRFPDGVHKGYLLEHFTDAFARYLPPVGNTRQNGYAVTPEHESTHERNRVTDQTPVTGEGENGAASLWAARAEPASTIVCADYRAHQSDHRQVGDHWTCDACQGVPVS